MGILDGINVQEFDAFGDFEKELFVDVMIPASRRVVDNNEGSAFNSPFDFKDGCAVLGACINYFEINKFAIEVFKGE
jgi:hypothetical protein